MQASLLARFHSSFEYVEDLEVDAIIGNNKLVLLCANSVFGFPLTESRLTWARPRYS